MISGTDTRLGCVGANLVMELGNERRYGNEWIPRHMHDEAGISIILSGGYEEAGDRGRFHLKAGDVVIHAPFDTHLDRFTRAGAHIFNLPSISYFGSRVCFGHISDPDLVVRIAERDPWQAGELVLSNCEAHSPRVLDWPDQLAQSLLMRPELCLGQWAREFGLAAATVTRGFKQVFGVPPLIFRAHVRAKLAWKKVVNSDVSLCQIAADLGFADQAHMTRAIRALTGKTPLMCRTQGQMDSRLLALCCL